ncbi:MAG: HDOD domain-containing protein [Deltaproteobacteria bacterium]|nr:HDOD domain-containing protein [Deltaproteobacteria bacterium]MBW2075558.1 HDOD domain-containing protein [Deltaproteobacteria bacterium]
MNEIARARLLKKIAEGRGLPSLSPLAIRLVELAADDRSCASDLTHIIEKDPALTTRLLRLVNSAFFGQEEQTTSISRAVVLLGFKQVRIMALSLSLRDTFPLAKVGGMHYDYFWKTSLYRALIAKDFAQSAQSPELNPDDAFVGGLILEIGLLMLYNVCPEELKEVFPGGDMPLEKAIAWEEENLGINHREAGRLVLQRWRFPEHLVESQKYFGPKALEPDKSLLHYILELAREATEIFFSQRTDLYQLQEAAQRLLGLDTEAVYGILSETFHRIEELSEHLRLDIDSQEDILEVMEKANQALARINASMETSLQGLLDQVVQYDQSVTKMSNEMTQIQKSILQNTLDAVAHEIRNPLLAIGGFAKRLADKAQGEDKGRQYAKIIAEESSRLERILKEVMDYCRDYEPVVFADEDLLFILDKVLDEFKALFDHKNINVIRDFPKDPVSVLVDADGIARALQQFLENAVQRIGHDHGTLRVSVQRLEQSRQVCIGISDNGRPIPAGIQDALLNSNPSTKTFGASLGLPMARKIIEAHNGHVQIKVKEGGDNTVEVYLPTI